MQVLIAIGMLVGAGLCLWIALTVQKLRKHPNVRYEMWSTFSAWSAANAEAAKYRKARYRKHLARWQQEGKSRPSEPLQLMVARLK